MAASSSYLVATAINHVLANETWARAKLVAFAGQSAKIEALPLQISLSITADGLFETPSTANHQTSVIISLPNDAPLKLISGDSSAIFASARISGSAEFAEALAFVFRNLEWDFESDLAGLIGDIPATRAVKALNALHSWQKSALVNVAHNFREYLTEESLQLIPQREIEAFCYDVNNLRDDLERLDKRISRL